MSPWDLLRAVWLSGAISVRITDGQVKAKWRGIAPDYIRQSFIDGKTIFFTG